MDDCAIIYIYIYIAAAITRKIASLQSHWIKWDLLTVVRLVRYNILFPSNQSFQVVALNRTFAATALFTFYSLLISHILPPTVRSPNHYNSSLSVLLYCTNQRSFLPFLSLQILESVAFPSRYSMLEKYWMCYCVINSQSKTPLIV